MAYDRPKYGKNGRTRVIVCIWIALYGLASCLYFALTCRFVQRIPALLVPSLVPLSVLSAWVSWRIEQRLDPDLDIPAENDGNDRPSEKNGKSSVLPLLWMSLVYSSFVEGFLYEWFLHSDLAPWVRIAVDLLCLSPFFTDAAATYVYKRFLGDDHESAANYVSTRLPEFVIPLLGFWILFSVLGNEVSNPILSFMIFDFGIIVWTVFFAWANRVDLPLHLRNSPHRILRGFGRMNDVLSHPLRWIYGCQLFGAYVRDLLILIFSLAIASELSLADVCSVTTLALAIGVLFTGWKIWEYRSETTSIRQASRTVKRSDAKSGPELRWLTEIRLRWSDVVSVADQRVVQLVSKLDRHVAGPVDPTDAVAHKSLS